MKANREIETLLKAAAEAGWRVTGGGRSHYKAYAPDGVTIITVPSTPSKGNRSIQNTRSLFRKAGLVV